MPLYEYECRQCKERVEIIQKFSDPPYSVCPKCAGEMRKLFSSPAIQFKGSGFYKTDYATSSSKPGSETKSESVTSDAKADTSAKTETKPETKSEAKAETKSSE